MHLKAPSPEGKVGDLGSPRTPPDPRKVQEDQRLEFLRPHCSPGPTSVSVSVGMCCKYTNGWELHVFQNCSQVSEVLVVPVPDAPSPGPLPPTFACTLRPHGSMSAAFPTPGLGQGLEGPGWEQSPSRQRLDGPEEPTCPPGQGCVYTCGLNHRCVRAPEHRYARLAVSATAVFYRCS